MTTRRHLLIGRFQGWFGIIKPPAAAANPPGNPYRIILRRDYPEPFIALVVFILGIWLWDHYLAKPEGYAPGTEEVALVKIDRDLRLADAMVEDPRWLRWLAAVDEPVQARRAALEAFGKLVAEKSIGPQGLEAFAIVKAEQDGLPVRGRMILNPEETAAALAKHQGTWWHAQFMTRRETPAPPGTHWRLAYHQDALQLRTRAVAVSAAVWLLGLVGLAFVPSTFRRLKGVFFTKSKGYGGAWPLPLGLVVFLVATLAWIGFRMILELGIDALPGLHPAAGIALDSAARLLPPLIAFGLLFRKPSHAVRVTWLDQPLALKAMLGTFSLLMLADQILREAMGSANEPGGGLSAGAAGLWGLAFTLISACVLGPLAEEMLYRGVLFRSFWNQLGVVPAALASSAVFAVLHFYDGYGLASVAIFGFSCALLYAATRSLTTAIALHMLYNTAIKLPEWIIYHAPLG